MKTRMQIAIELLAKNRNGSYEDWIKNVCDSLEEHEAFFKDERIKFRDELTNARQLVSDIWQEESLNFDGANAKKLQIRITNFLTPNK